MHCISLYYTALYFSVLQSTGVLCTALHCISLYCSALGFSVLQCTIFPCTAVYCISLYCNTLYFSELQCPVFFRTAVQCISLYFSDLYFSALPCAVQHCIYTLTKGRKYWESPTCAREKSWGSSPSDFLRGKAVFFLCSPPWVKVQTLTNFSKWFGVFKKPYLTYVSWYWSKPTTQRDVLS